jgi:hypothetical protein
VFKGSPEPRSDQPAGPVGFEWHLAYELPGAPEVQRQRLLQRHPEEPEALQLPSALQRTDVDGPQASVARAS